MLNTNFTSRLSASPWWPLVRWLGLPATLSNISIACWPVLQFHWVLSADPYSLTGGGGSWFDILGFATMATMLLVAVQVLVASLLLACSAGPFRLRLAAYAGYLLWLAGSLAVGFTMSQCLLFGLEGFRASSGVIIHDTYITFGAGPILAAVLPTFLLAIQSPYWLLRIFGGRRLQRPELDEPAHNAPGRIPLDP